MQLMRSLPGSKLEENELKAYKLLVKMEREIGWDNLLKIRSKLFLMEFENSETTKPSNKLNDSRIDLNASKVEDYEIYEEGEDKPNFMPGVNINEQSFFHIKSGGEAMMDRYREDVDTEDSVEEGDMPTFLKDDDDLDQSTAVLNEKTRKI
mmetsp:Transcript_11930/g.10296  ORF Transcript_11930/g.10296 Transcript_11930/m.10296 type:complete len:151 (+) Transcript_11930:1240-1692(+)